MEKKVAILLSKKRKQKKKRITAVADQLVRQHEQNEKLREKEINLDFLDLFKEDR